MTKSGFLSRPLLISLLVGWPNLPLSGQVEQIQAPEEVDLSASGIEQTGIRVIALRSQVKLDHGRPLDGAFLVFADPLTRTYWWTTVQLSQEAKAKRLSWARDIRRRYLIQKTAGGFTVFHISLTNLTIASSRGRYADEAQLASLVRGDFDAAPGRHLFAGFGFVDGNIRLSALLGKDFLLGPLSSIAAQPNLVSATQQADGKWELVVSSSLGRVAHITLARDFSVVSHRIVEPPQ